MFQSVRKWAGSAKGRRHGNVVNAMVPEALEARIVAAAHPALPGPIQDLAADRGTLSAAVVPFAAAAQGSTNTNGAAGQMPAFYDGKQFTVNMKEMPDDASASLIAKDRSVNTIYATNDLDEEQNFAPVIDAIQGDRFNPLWRQVLIVFNQGVTPHQFTSDEEVNAAASGPRPEITLVVTDEVYRCSVVGPGPKA
jgi:hypothetical protein